MVKKKPMKKDTHTIQNLYDLLEDKLRQMEKAETKTEQKKIRSEILRLDRMINDVNGKKLNGNGHGYIKEQPPKVTKQELLDLIDSVQAPEANIFREMAIKEEIALYKDLSGVSVGQDYFEYKDLGWEEPKHPYLNKK